MVANFGYQLWFCTSLLKNILVRKIENLVGRYKIPAAGDHFIDPWQIWMWLLLSNFQTHLSRNILSTSCGISHRWMPCWWQVIIGLDNGLVPSGSKPLSEPMISTSSIMPYGATRERPVVCCKLNQRFKIIYFLMGSWDPWAMILMGPRALGIGPIIDVYINWKF